MKKQARGTSEVRKLKKRLASAQAEIGLLKRIREKAAELEAKALALGGVAMQMAVAVKALHLAHAKGALGALKCDVKGLCVPRCMGHQSLDALEVVVGSMKKMMADIPEIAPDEVPSEPPKAEAPEEEKKLIVTG